MSNKAMAYVQSYSPYRGAMFLVHIMIGDTANDAHDEQLWMSQKWLAEKCRVSERTVWEALKVMTDDGWLTLMEDNSRRGQPNRYKFNYPQVDIVWNGKVRKECGPGSQSTAEGSATTAINPKKNPNEPFRKGSAVVANPPGFSPGSGFIANKPECDKCDGLGVWLNDANEAVECQCKRAA